MEIRVKVTPPYFNFFYKIHLLKIMNAAIN